MNLTNAQQKNLIANAILTQKISRLQYQDKDMNPQVQSMIRFLDGEIATLEAVSDMMHGNDTIIRLLGSK